MMFLNKKLVALEIVPSFDKSLELGPLEAVLDTGDMSKVRKHCERV